MPIIKPKSSGSEMQSPVVLHLGDLQREAERLEAEAVARAKQIIDEAQRERERLISDAEQVGHKQGYDKGYTEGLEAGRAAGHEEAVNATRESSHQLVEAWQNALGSFEHLREDILHETRRSVLTLAALIAEKVARRAVQLDPSVAARHIEAALELVQRPSRLNIRIHPDDRASAEEILPIALQRLHHSTHTNLIDDQNLNRGSVIVQTEHATIDASIDTQIQRLIEAVLPTPHARPLPEPETLPDPDEDSSHP